MQQVALETLCRLFAKKDKHLFFIIDDTQTLKRAKKMEAVGKLHHHATGKYGIGHTILKVCLYYRGVTIPWASLSAKVHITVLFDAFYLCSEV